jgi:hypothetical protein
MAGRIVAGVTMHGRRASGFAIVKNVDEFCFAEFTPASGSGDL